MVSKQECKNDIQSLYSMIIDHLHNDSLLFVWDQMGKLTHPPLPQKNQEELLPIYYHDIFTTSIHDKLNCCTDNGHLFTFTNYPYFSFTDRHYHGAFYRIEIDEQSYTIAHISGNNCDKGSQLELEDLHAQLMTGQLAAGYVHEIRNPLTSIKGFIQLLQAGISQEEQYYKVVIAEIEKIEKLTTQLLDVAKPTNNKVKRFECIESMLKDVIFLFQANTEMKDVDIQMQLEDACMIKCNRMQMKQALINLIKNSIEAMQYKGEVSIRGSRKGSNYELFIHDNGPGIPEAVIENLGQPFVSTKQKGTGLGLMISKKLIEDNNGDMSILVEETEGCSVKITFPFVKDNNEIFM